MTERATAMATGEVDVSAAVCMQHFASLLRKPCFKSGRYRTWCACVVFNLGGSYSSCVTILRHGWG